MIYFNTILSFLVSDSIFNDRLGEFACSSGKLGEVIGQVKNIGFIHAESGYDEYRFGVPGTLEAIRVLGDYCVYGEEASNGFKAYGNHRLFTLKNCLHAMQETGRSEEVVVVPDDFDTACDLVYDRHNGV